MDKHFVNIRAIDHVTHDTLRVVTDKPENYHYVPGQATEIAINKNGWQNRNRIKSPAGVPPCRRRITWNSSLKPIRSMTVPPTSCWT